MARRAIFRAAFVAAFISFVSIPVLADEGAPVRLRSALSATPETCGSRTLACEQLRGHELSILDCYDSGWYFTGFYVQLTTPRSVTFRANSFEFAPYVFAYSTSNSDAILASDENPSRRTDVSLSLSLPAGNFMFVVSAVDKFDGGAFAVGLDCELAPPPAYSGDPLLLRSNRFRVMLDARDHRTNKNAGGLPIPQNEGFGYFSLPGLTGDATNPEVFVKVVDGRPVNGKWWVFYGGLTDLELTIRVTDTVTGATKTYFREGGSSAGGFDVTAF